MATTPGGTYYAAPTEALTDWPATSENLALQLESRLAAKAPIAAPTFTGTISTSSANAYNPSVTVENSTNDANAAYLRLAKKRGSAIVANGDQLGTLVFSGWNGSSFNEAAAIYGQVDGAPGATNDMPGRLIFATTADGAGGFAERMRISNDGTVTFANVYAKTVGATNRDLYIDNGGVIGYVSSIRASKTEITPQADPYWLLGLQPVTFRYRAKDEDGNYTDTPDGPVQYGLIAEDVEAVNPDVVFYDDTDTGPELRGVAYSALITPLLALVQQQQSQIDALTARLDAAGL